MCLKNLVPDDYVGLFIRLEAVSRKKWKQLSDISGKFGIKVVCRNAMDLTKSLASMVRNGLYLF